MIQAGGGAGASTGYNQNWQRAEDASFKWVAGFIVLIGMILLLNRTRLGHVFLYYSVCLLLVLITVTHGSYFADILKGFVNPLPA